MALSNIMSMMQMQQSDFANAMAISRSGSSFAPQGMGSAAMMGMFQGLLGGGMGFPFMMGGNMGMMGLLMAQYSQQMQQQQAMLMQAYAQQQAQSSQAGSGGAGSRAYVDGSDAQNLSDYARQAIRSGASPADSWQGALNVPRQFSMGNGGQVYSSAATHGPTTKAVDDSAAASKYGAVARLNQFAAANGSKDGSFIMASTSAQQDEANFARLGGAIAAGEDDMQDMTKHAGFFEKIALNGEEEKLQAAAKKARAQGLPMSDEAIAKQRIMYREKLAKEGRLSPAMAKQNEALKGMYHDKDLAEVNMGYKWGRPRGADGTSDLVASSAFNPKRSTEPMRPLNTKAEARVPKAIQLSPYRDYSINGSLTRGKADELGLDPLPVWN